MVFVTTPQDHDFYLMTLAGQGGPLSLSHLTALKKRTRRFSDWS